MGSVGGGGGEEGGGWRGEEVEIPGAGVWEYGHSVLDGWVVMGRCFRSSCASSHPYH